jgi:hypothetical protein
MNDEMNKTSNKPFGGRSVVSPTTAGIFFACALVWGSFALNDILEFSAHRQLDKVIVESFFVVMSLFIAMTTVIALKRKKED